MIQIRVTDIPVRGLRVKDTLSLEALNQRMAEAPDNDIQFVEPPSFSLSLIPELAGTELTGTISAAYSRPCGICLNLTHQLISEKIALTLKQKSVRPGIDKPTESEEWEDDVGIIYFDGEHINLEEILQETLILSINPLQTDHKNCSGLPQEATVDSANRKLTFGDLIEKAQRENG